MLPWDVVGIGECNNNGDCIEVEDVEVEGAKVEGMVVGWIGVVCTDCAMSVGVVEAMDLSSDTMKEFETC